MIKEAIGVGNDEVQALEDACRQLGVETYEVEFETLQRAEKGFLGIFGKSQAKVRAFIKTGPAETAVQFVKDVLGAMDINSVDVKVTEEEAGAVIELEGEEVGSIIGRRGETLDALQYLTGLVANHVDNSYYKITINTGNYREKREKTLEILGRKLAFKALKTGMKTSLEPMNPYERRVIHTAVQKVNGATSWSEGENLQRHVVIGPDENYKPRNDKYRGRNNNNRGGRGRGRGGYNSRPKYTAEKSDRAPINEGEGMGLYGRIDK